VAVILPLLSARPTLGGLKKIAMDDSEFSSVFSVYSADAVSAMYASRPPLCGACFALEAVPADRSD
jgi:putative galanin